MKVVHSSHTLALFITHVTYEILAIPFLPCRPMFAPSINGLSRSVDLLKK